MKSRRQVFKTILKWLPTIVLPLATTLTVIAYLSPPALCNESKRILAIGDSHSAGTFGKHLDALLRREFGSHQVHSLGSCGSRPSWFLNGQPTKCGYRETTYANKTIAAKEHATPLLTELLKESPDYFLVEMGGNILAQPESIWDNELSAIIDTLKSHWGLTEIASPSAALSIHSVHAKRCFWITNPITPSTKPELYAKLFEMVQAQVAPYCTVIDSRNYAHWPEGMVGDKMHFDSLGEPGRKAARVWADGVFSELSADLEADSITTN